MMAPEIRVLYIDDEPDLLSIGKLYLEREGRVAVDTLTSAMVALKQLEKERYDAIISDYQMPVMDGIAFLKQLKASGNTTPFIIFTGKGREEVVIEALNNGADFYLQKGGEPKAQFAELSNKIRYAVARRQVEEKLSESQKRTADIIEFLPDATFAINTDGEVIAWNRAMENMTGVTAAEILGTGNYEYSIPIYNERRPMLIDLVLLDNPSDAAKYPSLKRNGRTLVAEAISANLYNGRGATIWFTAAPLYNNQGEVVGAIESIRDITDLKRAEVERRESEERYRHVVEEQTELICRFLPDGTHIFVNEAYCRYFGLSYNNIIGTRFRPIIHPDDREHVTRIFASLTPENPLVTIDQRIIMPDGSTRWQRWVDRAFFHADGSLKEYQSVGRDMTDWKQNEEALAESESFNRNLVENLPDYIIAYGLDGKILYVNPATVRALGYTAEELVGTSLLSYVAEEYRNIKISRKTDRLEGDEVPPYEIDLLSRDGHRISVIVKGTPIRYHDSPAILLLFNDITGRKQAEEAIRTAEETYRNIFLNSQIGLFRTDIHTGLILDANDTVARFIGYQDRASLLAEPFSIAERYIDPSDREKMISQLQAHGEFLNHEARFRKNDGSIIWMRFSGRLVKEKGWIEGVSEDITERKRAEEALRESEAHLKRAEEVSGSGNWELRLNKNTFKGSEGAWTLYGLEGAQCGIKEVQNIPLPEYRPLLDTALADLITGKSPYNVEFKIRRPSDGMILDIHSLAEYDPDRNVVFGVIHDITGRKLTEERLMQSEILLRNMIESPQSIKIFSLDLDFRYLAFNARHQETMKAIWGVDIRPGMNMLNVIGYEGDRKKAQRNFERALAGEHFTLPEEYGDEALGRKFWEDTYSPIYDENRRVIGLTVYVIEITERKRAEDELRETERRLEEIINFLPDATFAIDYEGRVIAWNRAIEEMTSIKAEDMLGKGNYEYALPFYGERRPILIDLVMMQGQGALNNYSAVRKDGDALTAETDRARVGGKEVCLWGKSVLFKNSLGEVVGAIESIRDITDRKMVEIALKKSRNLYRAIFETTGAATIIVGSDTTIILANSGFAKFSGFSIDELEGKKSWTEFVTGEDLERMKRYHHDRRDRPYGAPGVYEFRFVDRYGETRHCLNNIGVIPGTTQSVASIVDITGLKQAETALRQTLDQLTKNEQELRESEGKYRTVFENTGTATVVLNEGNIIELANFRFAQLSGFSKDEIEGKKRWTEFVVPEDLERMHAQHQMRRQDREKALTSYEFRFVTKTGDIRSIYLFVDIIPGTKKSIASLLDITERKRAEELYHTVFENTGTAMIIVEENSVISHVNEEMEKIWGYSREEIEGRVKWQTLVAEEDLGKMQKYHGARRIGPGNAPSDYEFRFIHKNGEVRDADLTVTIIPGTQKSVVSLRDITDLKKLDRQVRERTDQVEQLLRQKDEFIAQAGHDLKTPLTPIIALLPHILKKEQDPELREILTMVISDAAAMKHLITDILTLAKLNTLYTTADAKEIVLAAEVEKGIAMHTWMAEKQGNVIENTVSPDTRIWIMPLHLESLLDNLIGNAIRYSPDGGIVTISSYVTEEFIAISITDTGIGLTPEETVRIFDLFYKADTSRHQRDSSGLGLSIVSRIAHLYGGSVKAESPGKGCGSTFTVTLPRRS